MEPKIKKKWLTALRSGKYKQGRACLRSSNDEFCCLGVLCDLYDPNGWIEMKSGRADWGYGPDENTVAQPYFVNDWADLQETIVFAPDCPLLARVRETATWVESWATLPGMNDEGVPFALIADIIEKYL